jgi:hypothetical protein
MADHSVFSTAGRTPSAQMDADLSTLHAPEAAAEVVDEGCRRVVSAARSTSFGLRPVSTRTTSAWQFVERPILPRKRPPARCRWSTIRTRSARQYLERHPPQSRDIGRCSPASYGRGGVALRGGCRSCDKSGRPSYAASSACHKRPTLSRCFQPSDAPAGHIDGLICEDLHEVDLERDIGNQWFGAMVARLPQRSSTAP